MSFLTLDTYSIFRGTPMVEELVPYISPLPEWGRLGLIPCHKHFTPAGVTDVCKIEWPKHSPR
jgi:hypothetical protein